MWIMFKVFIELVQHSFCFYILGFWLQAPWNLSSLTRDRTHTPSVGKKSLNHWTAKEVPIDSILYLLQLQCYLLREALPRLPTQLSPSCSLHDSIASAWHTVGAQEIVSE